MKKLLLISLMGLCAAPLGGLAGCRTDRLETGYVPNRLGSTETQRRGYYARPYSREAAEAQSERLDRRPAQSPMMR